MSSTASRCASNALPAGVRTCCGSNYTAHVAPQGLHAASAAPGSDVCGWVGLHNVASSQPTAAVPGMQGAVHAVIMQNRLRHLVEEKHNGEMQDQGTAHMDSAADERTQEAARYARIAAHL